MAAIAIPESVQRYFPQTIDPAQLCVNYKPKANALIVYCTGKPVLSIWDDIDEDAYIGFALDNETVVTGVMIEYFSKWLLVPGHTDHELQLVG